MSKRRLPYPAGAPLNEGGYPAFDSNGRPTPWTEARARRHAQYVRRPVAPASSPDDTPARRAADRALAAAEAAALRAQVVHGFRRPPGKLYGVDEVAQVLIGPYGAIAVSTLLVRTLAMLAGKGRHDPETLLAAGWRDLEHLSTGLANFAGTLAAVGLRLDRRKAGWRITRPRPAR